MNILLCCENYTPSVGGVQEVMRQIAERLATRGHAVTVFTSRHPHRPMDTTVGGVRVRSFDIGGNLVQGLRGDIAGYRQSVQDPQFQAVLIKAAQQWSFDALTPILDRISARKVFIPCGFSGLFDPAWGAYYGNMEGWLRAFDELIFYSGTYRDIEFARARGLEKLHVLPNGVDEREFGSLPAGDLRAEIGIDPGAFMILSVGTLIRAKGHWEMLRAFDIARLSVPSVLVINGNDPYGRWLNPRRVLARVRSRTLPLSWLARGIERRHRGAKRVLLVNWPRPKLVQAFKSSDLFAFASHVEYSPLVLFEAAAAGTPFLSSAVGNAREIAQWTSGGFVYDAVPTGKGAMKADPRVLASRLEECAANRARLREMGQAARERVMGGGYTWNAIVPRYEAILVGARSATPAS